MTEQEVIKKHIEECKHRAGVINMFLETGENIKDETIRVGEKNIAILKTAITALEEIQQYRAMQSDIIKNNAELMEYRAIGTVEECREAVEKQRAKKPNLEGDGYADGQMVYDTWICPCCEKSYEIEYEDHKHCPNCGQAIEDKE